METLSCGGPQGRGRAEPWAGGHLASSISHSTSPNPLLGDALAGIRAEPCPWMPWTEQGAWAWPSSPFPKPSAAPESGLQHPWAPPPAPLGCTHGWLCSHPPNASGGQGRAPLFPRLEGWSLSAGERVRAPPQPLHLPASAKLSFDLRRAGLLGKLTPNQHENKNTGHGVGDGGDAGAASGRTPQWRRVWREPSPASRRELRGTMTPVSCTTRSIQHGPQCLGVWGPEPGDWGCSAQLPRQPPSSACGFLRLRGWVLIT